MTGYNFPEAPHIEEPWREAFRAFAALIPEGHLYVREDDCLITEVISQFPWMLQEAELAAAAAIGPLIHWQAPPPSEWDWKSSSDWDLIVTSADLDNSSPATGPVRLARGTFEGPDSDWTGSTLDQAGTAYRRECKWDFPPGDAGIWLLMLAPVSGFGGQSEPWSYTGHLAGFAVLYDRDEDGEYESVGHLWSASAWRRRGIARQLLQEARSRFGARDIEGPFTDDGDAFVRACAESPE